MNRKEKEYCKGEMRRRGGKGNSGGEEEKKANRRGKGGREIGGRWVLEGERGWGRVGVGRYNIIHH